MTRHVRTGECNKQPAECEKNDDRELQALRPKAKTVQQTAKISFVFRTANKLNRLHSVIPPDGPLVWHALFQRGRPDQDFFAELVNTLVTGFTPHVDQKARKAQRTQISLCLCVFVVSDVSLSAPPVIQSGHMFPDIPHEENRAILGKECRGSCLGDRDRESKAALGLIPKLAIAIKTKRHLLVVDDHFLQ